MVIMKSFKLIITLLVILTVFFSGCVSIKIEKCAELCAGEDKSIPVVINECRKYCNQIYYYGGEKELDKEIESYESGKQKTTKTSITLSTTTTTSSQEETQPYIYDAFSEDALDTNKWLETNETTYFKHQHLDEHYHDIINHNYHTKQNAEADKGTFLIMRHTFYPGDTVEYDVDYVSGSGNRVSRIVINDRPLDDIVRHVPCIGYWNGDCASNNFGRHHVKVVFRENSVDVYMTKPDESVFSQNVGSFSSPFTFGINSRTGHNGLLHFDYDNFYVY